MSSTTRTPPRMFFLLAAATVAIGPFAIDTYLPALPQMAERLGSDIVAMNLTVSIYLVGFGIGQLLGGPLSDQIGRMKIGIPGLAVFIAASVMIALADSALEVQIYRFVQAVGGGFGTVIAMAMMRDLYSPVEAAKRIPMVVLVMLAAPLLAPAIGALLLPLGWPVIFFFLAGYALVVIGLLLPVGETNTHASPGIDLKRVIPQYIEVVTRKVDGKRIPLRYLLAQGFQASIMMVFITNSAFIYLDYFPMGPEQFPLFFGANVVAMMLFTFLNTRMVQTISPFRIFRAGRLLQCIAIVALTIGVGVFTPTPLWVTPLLALAIGCNGWIGPSITSLYLANFSRLSGSATSLINFATFGFGSLMGGLSNAMFDGTLKPIVLTMLAAVICANAIAFSIPAPRGFVGEEE